MGCEVLSERGGAGVAAFGGEQNTGLIDIDEQGDMVAPRRAAVSSMASRVTLAASACARACST